MRWCVALALISTLVSPDAVAAPKGGKDAKKKKDKEPAASMDTGGDPAAKEQSDSGPYRPKGKTGALAEKEETQQEEAEEVVKATPRDKRLLFADFVVGFGAAPKPGPAFAGNNRTQDATALGVVVGAAFDVSKTFTLGIRVPWSTALIDRVTGSGTNASMAFGSPELLGELRHPLAHLWTMPILFGIGIPLAQGNPDPSGTQISAAAKSNAGLIVDAAGGWRDGELYAPKRLPIVLGVGVQYSRRALEFHAYTKLVAGINVGAEIRDPKIYGTDPTGQLGTLELNAVSLRNVTLAGVRYDFLKKPLLWVGADLWMVYNPLEPIEYDSSATPPSPFQFVAEPRLGAAFGKVRPSLGFIYPLGGRLADSGIMGLRAHLDFAF